MRLFVNELHNEIITSINSLANSETINSRRNIIGDILRGVLGVFLAAVTFGTVLASKRFRNTFFKIDSNIILEDANEKMNQSLELMLSELQDFEPARELSCYFI